MNIDLSNPFELPDNFLNRLKAIEGFCHDCSSWERLVERDDVSALVRDINDYCQNQRIIGIHYTRAMPDSIYSQGLLVRNGREIRATFLSEHGHLFSEDEVKEIKQRWEGFYTNNQSKVRDGRISFNFTEKALGTSGSKHLLGLFGGEQVSMCFELDEPIGIKLGSIGEPLLVRCSLDPSQVRTSTEGPWGEILVSSFHFMVNPKASRLDLDGKQSVPVKPSDIVKIRKLTNQS